MAKVKVKLKASFSGITFFWKKGQEVEVDKEEARRMCEAGLAEPVVSARPKTRKATSRRLKNADKR